MIRVKRLKRGTEQVYHIASDRELTDEQIMSLALALSGEYRHSKIYVARKILLLLTPFFISLPILLATQCDPPPPPGQEEKP